MPTYDISGYAQYQVNTSTNASAFQGTTVQSFTFDDGEMDTTFENGDVLGNVGGNDLNYLGNLSVPLSGGGGSVELALVQGAASFVDPDVIEVLIVVPTGLSVSDFTFPNPLDYAARETDPFTTCFAAGTQILTEEGEKAVETLEIGDSVVTAEGGAVPVKWIGRQTLAPFFARHRAQPVRIAAGALGDGLPNRDLTVTADHGMVLDGYVINASALVNGTSITYVPLDDLDMHVTVYHVETEAHDVIFANGAPSETYVDVVTRETFDNHEDYLALYGAERIIPEMPRPRISTARLLPDAIRARLGIADAATGLADPGETAKSA